MYRTNQQKWNLRAGASGHQVKEVMKLGWFPYSSTPWVRFGIVFSPQCFANFKLKLQIWHKWMFSFSRIFLTRKFMYHCIHKSSYNYANLFDHNWLSLNWVSKKLKNKLPRNWRNWNINKIVKLIKRYENAANV